MYGLAGKILRLNLSNRKFDTIDTTRYEKWVGGEAMGTAIFWDEIDKDYIFNTHNRSGFEPANIIIILSGPLQGTLAPSGGRCQVVGLSPEAYPRPQFTGGNFGGKFSSMMKFAGYDAIVVKGTASSPLWVNILDDQVTFEDAGPQGDGLWGMDTYEAQIAIWKIVAGGGGRWRTVGRGESTQVPAVVLIGQAGENQVRSASLQHGGGHANGQGGFGAVFGSKNLKAISVLGTGSIPIARPKELLEARTWYRHYTSGKPSVSKIIEGKSYRARPMGCFGCDSNSSKGCFHNVDTGGRGIYSGNMCVEASFNANNERKLLLDMAKIIGWNDDVVKSVKPAEGWTWGTTLPAADLQRYGINASLLRISGMPWLKSLFIRGYLGKGKRIETDMDFSKCLGTDGAFATELVKRIVFKKEIGADLAEGSHRCAAKWGVLEEDLLNGVLPLIYFLGESHWGVYAAYAWESLFGVRDINSHKMLGIADGVPDNPARMENQARRFAELAAPWHDPLGLDAGETGVYSLSMAKGVAWGRRYTTFYTNSSMLCDLNSPFWFNKLTESGDGLSPEFETRFLNAITGMDITYDEGLEIGRKAWNLQRAMLTLHGRHREEEYFPPYPPYDSYVYHEGEPYIQDRKSGATPPSHYMVWKNGGWAAEPCRFPLSKSKSDEFKTIYYKLEGWDPKTGWPKRSTLENLGLKEVADELERRGRLGE